MSTWLLPRSDLKPEQEEIVRLPASENRIVTGGAGSGKTQVLIHRARHLADVGRVPPERFRAFVFTNAIREYIRSGFQTIDLPDDCVCTFDAWCYAAYERHIRRAIPRRGRGPDFAAIRAEVLDLLRRRRELRESLDFALVDEGQDLSLEAYEILKLAARHVTVFFDPQQKIFEDGARLDAIVESLGVRRSGRMLLETFRNAPTVARLASHFISGPEARERFLGQIRTWQKVRERPLCFVADSFEAEMDRMAEIVRGRQLLNERVGIIVAGNKQVHGYTKGLAERSVQVQRVTTRRKGTTVHMKCDFANELPKIATFHMAKGLTFDTVILPRLTERAFMDAMPRAQGEARRRFLFVGIARATQYVYLSTERGQELAEMELLRAAAEAGDLEIQEGRRGGVLVPGDEGRIGGEGPQGRSPPESEEDDDFSLL